MVIKSMEAPFPLSIFRYHDHPNFDPCSSKSVKAA